jgi:arylsulfatase A-like enzyme
VAGPARAGGHNLAEYLQAAGYDTGAYVTNPYLKPETRTDQGFTRFHHDFVKSWTTNRDDWWQQSSYADTVNAEVLEWLEGRPAERPFFAYVHYIDVHGPWTWAPFLTPQERAVVDVLPTVLDLAGLKPHPSAVLHGASLAPIMTGGRDHRPAIFAEVDDSAKDSRARAMVASGEKLIEVERPRRARLLYDLTRDPREMANLETMPVGQRQAEFARMGAAFGRWHSQRRAAPPVLLSPETIERLRALGYIK